MKRLAIAQYVCLAIHIASLVFGLAGLLLVLPNPKFIANLPSVGQIVFSWSMAGGGAIYMLAGAATIALYTYRNLGLRYWLTFMIPALLISLSAELLGTSTGLPFGHYHYLTGLGYKIAGLVPFTIPLSWFYMGFSAFILAYVSLAQQSRLGVLKAIALGAVLLTSWDFVLDPAMSQTVMPFWAWEVPGAFFGMPYQNFVGWFGTGATFMGIATVFWHRSSDSLKRVSLFTPFMVYVSNFVFAMAISLGSGIYPPIFLGILFGIAPAFWLHQLSTGSKSDVGDTDVSVSPNPPSESFDTLSVSSQGEL